MHIFALLLAASVLAMVGLVGYVYWRIRHHLRGTPQPERKPVRGNLEATPVEPTPVTGNRNSTVATNGSGQQVRSGRTARKKTVIIPPSRSS